MSVLTPTLPHVLSVPMPVTKFSSTSSDGTLDGEGIVSSLSTSYSMASALTTTATDTSTVHSHSQHFHGDENEKELELGEVSKVEEGYGGSGENEESVQNGTMSNENLISNASPNVVGADSGTRPNRVGQTQTKDEDLMFTSASDSFKHTHSQIMNFTAKSASLHNAPRTPTSTSASMSIPLPIPSPKSDVDGSFSARSTAAKQQHRKSMSLGGVISSAKVQGSTQTQHRLVQLKGRTGSVDVPMDEKERTSSVPQQKTPQQPQQQQLLVNTPPEMLPPSPPLTNDELEMDEDDMSLEGDRGRDDEDADADADADADVDTDGHTRSQSQSQTETSDAPDEDDDGDVDGVNPQVEADIAHGWQAPDSKLETTPGTPVLPSQSPSTTSLPLPASSQPVQANRLTSALSKSALSPTSPERLATLNDPLSPSSSSSKSPLRVKISPIDIDLEKGDEVGHVEDGNAKRRASIEAEAETLGPLGVTKTFEVIRSPKRFSSPRPPRSSYYMGPPSGPTAFGSAPAGQIGLHHPREIVRVERDYDHGELVQFSSAYPLEFEGRITPTQFLETINAINEHLIRAHSLSGAFFFNLLAILTLWISPFFVDSTYKKEMRNLQLLVDALNAELYNPRGLNILWPRRNAFLFVSFGFVEVSFSAF